MDHLEVLVTQHNDLRTYLRNARAATSAAERTRKLEALRSELELHIYLEESFVYPVLEEYDLIKRQVYGFWREHERLLEELQAVQSVHQQEQEFQRRIAVFNEHLDEHLREEEHHVFPEARRIVGADHLEAIARKLKETVSQRRIVA